MVKLPTIRIHFPISPCLREIYWVKVSISYFSASSLNRQAISAHAVMIPATQPTAVHISNNPVAYAAPGNPSNAQDDSPVARSDKAATQPGKLRPAIAKSELVFTFLP